MSETMIPINIIPKVNRVESPGKGSYVLIPGSVLDIPKECPRAGRLLREITGMKEWAGDLSTTPIRLEICPGMENDEGYVLRIDTDGIWISAKSDRGMFYGVQSLRQLLPDSVETIGLTEPVALPHVVIEDSPRFAYRGFMLDEARHFFGMKEVKRILDLLALQKINKFHWHLTDHQGWRIEIKEHPKLTEIGSRRSKTQVTGLMALNATYDPEEVSGYYTQEQIREIVQYAAENFIDVIPEIDLPGHSTAALAAYPELSCDGSPVEVGFDIGFRSFFTLPKLICAGKESSYIFLQTMLDEMAALFPSKMIHLGSDEAGKGAWRKCPHCQRRMKEQGLKGVKELQDYFINRLARYLFDKGFSATCWNDGLHNHSDERIIIQHWVGAYKETEQKIKAGYKAIISTMTPYYLNNPYALSNLKKSYAYDPLEGKITDPEARNILGIEAPFWTEFVKSAPRLEWGMFPRLLAVSETAWTEQKNKEYEDFTNRLAVMETRLDALGVNRTPREYYQKDNKFFNPLSIIKSMTGNPNREYEEYLKKRAGITAK